MDTDQNHKYKPPSTNYNGILFAIILGSFLILFIFLENKCERYNINTQSLIIKTPIDLHPRSVQFAYKDGVLLAINGLDRPNGWPRADGDEAQRFIIDPILSKCRHDNIVVDIGGMWGDFGLLAAGKGCVSYIIEPQITQYRYIKLSITANDMDGSVTAFNYGVGPQRGFIHKKTGEAGQTQFEFTETRQNESDSFVYPLEHIVDLNLNILILKIDVEGYDVGVLKTAKHWIENEMVSIIIIMEYTPWWNEPGQGEWDTVGDWVNSVYPDHVRFAVLHRNQPKCFLVDDFVKLSSVLKQKHIQVDIAIVFDPLIDLDCGTWMSGTKLY